MSTTTIRLEEDLKARIAAAAERAGKTSHAFILEAIESTVEQAEVDAEFHRLAEHRWSGILSGGKTVPIDDAAAYLRARARGERTKRPAGRKLKA